MKGGCGEAKEGCGPLRGTNPFNATEPGWAGKAGEALWLLWSWAFRFPPSDQRLLELVPPTGGPGDFLKLVSAAAGELVRLAGF